MVAAQWLAVAPESKTNRRLWLGGVLVWAAMSEAVAAPTWGLPALVQAAPVVTRAMVPVVAEVEVVLAVVVAVVERLEA
jgi:hypothetical protein